MENLYVSTAVLTKRFSIYLNSELLIKIVELFFVLIYYNNISTNIISSIIFSLILYLVLFTMTVYLTIYTFIAYIHIYINSV